MHGLIFVTFEKYLGERYGSSLLGEYRQAIGQGPGEGPLTSRVYSDELLLAGLGEASRLTRAPVDTLLFEYGRYFMLNGLTSRLCSYLLDQVDNGRDLLLLMSRAHEQMSHAEAITPPVFDYQVMSGDPQGLYLRYDSPRQLCSLLAGSIEGAAQRYGERAQVSEQSCMKRGADACVFAIRFTPAARVSGAPDPLSALASGVSHAGAEESERREAQRQLADLVYAVLPDSDGATLHEAQQALSARHPELPEAARPFIVLEAINHLAHAGWVATSANQPGDGLGTRRYWRVPRSHHGRR